MLLLSGLFEMLATESRIKAHRKTSTAEALLMAQHHVDLVKREKPDVCSPSPGERGKLSVWLGLHGGQEIPLA